MKLAFSTNAFTRFSLPEALRRIRAAGFAGVEILADAPHAYPDEIDAAVTRRIAADLEQTGLAVSNVNANCTFGFWKDAPPEPYFEPSLISPEPRHRQERTRLILKTLQFAKDIGARNISITSGRMLASMPPDSAAAQFAESIKPILDRAESLGVDVGIECEPGLFLEYAAELRDWINRLAHPRFGANLDIGHSQVMGESVPQAVRMLAGKIWNFHVEDIPGKKHYHLIPGQGTMDWPGLRDALDEIGYDRFLTVELYTHTAEPDEAARKSLAFLSELFNSQPAPQVILYTKPGCHLCEVVESVILAVGRRRPLRLVKKNILDDPADQAKYHDAIPVIEIGGVEVARYHLTQSALDAALDRLPAP